MEWLTLGHTQRHTEFWALRELNLRVGKGECVGIIGPNGAGKSTLLKILSGTVTPTAGTFTVTGRVLSLLELGTGFNPELTGRANILETASLLGYGRDEVHDRIEEIQAFAELGEFFDRPLKLYSSGMTVRLAFSMFVSMRPDVLIVDEALAVGDIGFQRRCYQRMEQMLAGGMTCLFVTHDLTAVQRFCHRALVLQGGCLLYEGPPREACNVLNKIYFGEVAVDDSTDYGDGSAAIDRIWFEDKDRQTITSSASHEPLVFCYSVRFNEAVEGPVCGFHIKTVYGVEIALASSDYLGYELGNFTQGDRLTLRWTLDPHLNPGTYFFGCGCRHASGARFMSRRVDAVRFPITDQAVMGGIINPFRDLSLEHTRDS